jgi:RimJ/RimL family protein N-acetyltransferase
MDISVVSPFPFEALPRCWRWIESFRHKVSDDFSPKTLDEFVAVMAEQWPRLKTWAIYANDELGGLVTFERISPWVGTAHMVLKPDFQGKGFALKALRQTFGEMFALGVGRLHFDVLQGNLAVGSLIVNLGGVREGCLRGHTLQAGNPVDVWQYGLSKSVFEEKNCELLIRQQQQIVEHQHPDHDVAGERSLQPAV